MSIVYYEKERVFKLDTKSTSYLIGIVDEEQFIGHIYYGRKINSHNLSYLMRTEEGSLVPSKNPKERINFFDSFPSEYPTHGLGDYRETAIGLRTKSGHTALQLGYVSHRIIPGKPKLIGLPATFGSEEECTTLEITLEDKLIHLKVILTYTVFEMVDAITRSVKVFNDGYEEIYLNKVLSASFDMEDKDFDLITMHGTWGRECHIDRYPLSFGNHNVGSICGKTGHSYQPFMALVHHSTTQDFGEVYAMNFVYSGNFLAQASLDHPNKVRFCMGIHPSDFRWKLQKGDEFQSPEVVLVYSNEGIGGMTRTFHDLYRNHLIRGIYKDKKRPILLNNWEATYFDFNTEKLLQIAEQAAQLGIEMLVMDDGWFGKRNDDNTSLGDWFVNKNKLPGGLKHLVDQVNALGMKFGIWFEPEMISPDSELYREHPDWAIAIPGRTPGLRRNQYVLDLSRQEIVDYVYQMVSDVLHSANIEYVKWDMNRSLSDLGSLGLPANRQGELLHRYVLGVYELQDRLTKEFPNLLLENCSSGGGRFDPGMLYYSPQIWCSDDTDAIERLEIQEGTALIYPLSTIGAHISDCPNHALGRTTPFETRGYVALAGTFGYELDVTKISEADRNMIPEQVRMYHKYNDLVRRGDYYRIESYAQNHRNDCYMVVSKDKKEVLVTFIQVIVKTCEPSKRIFLKGLNPELTYKLEGDDRVYTGEELMYAGYQIDFPWACGDYKGKLLHFYSEEE